MQRIAVAVLFLAAACKTVPQREGGGPRSTAAEPLRLCVQNQTVAYGNVVAHAGTVRFDVMSGEEVCKRVPGTQPTMVLRAVTSAGGATGPLTFATTLQPGVSRCWTWRLTDAPGNVGELLPCDIDGSGRAPSP
ncbi:MAG TPA: hypothetical protein VF771_12115 [Longimicrobiaceae bacterium]